MLEDDLYLADGFAAKVAAFLGAVPDDWDQLMIGGQHFGSSGEEVVVPAIYEEIDIVRCTNAQRTHAYGIRGQFMRDLYQRWISTMGHCDHIMGPMQANYRVYAPQPFLCGQSRSKSDINGRVNAARTWNAARDDLPILVLDMPRHVVADLRRYGVHTGYCRESTTDYDAGLAEIFKDSRPGRVASIGPSRIVSRLNNWLGTLQWEVAAADNLVLGVWHPTATTDLVQEAAGKWRVFGVKAETLDEALRRLKAIPEVWNRLEHAPKVIPLIVLDCPKSALQELRKHGFHTGYDRDPETDLDRGLDWIYHGRADHDWVLHELTKWAAVLRDEAETIPDGVVAAWHPEWTTELAGQLEASLDEEVAIVSGATVEEVFDSLKQKGETQPCQTK